MERIHEFLKRVIGNKEAHACWLNSLSYLEYRGSRKLLRALGTAEITPPILAHAMEEVRHALFFKRLAIEEGGERFGRYSSSTLLAEAAIKEYFHELDQAAEAAISKLEGGGKLPVYQFVTWIIEERAVTVYRVYNALLREAGSSIRLDPVLQDEGRHLGEVQADTRSFSAARGFDPGALLRREQELFAKAWSALEACVG